MRENGSASFRVVNYVTGQEYRGSDNRRQHAPVMRHDIFTANEAEACEQKYRAQPVESGIEGGQVGEGHRSRSSRRMPARISALTFFGSIPSPVVSNTP